MCKHSYVPTVLATQTHMQGLCSVLPRRNGWVGVGGADVMICMSQCVLMYFQHTSLSVTQTFGTWTHGTHTSGLLLLSQLSHRAIFLLPPRPHLHHPSLFLLITLLLIVFQFVPPLVSPTYPPSSSSVNSLVSFFFFHPLQMTVFGICGSFSQWQYIILFYSVNKAAVSHKKTTHSLQCYYNF